MTIWVWVAIIVLVIYLMFRRPKQNATAVPEQPREEKVVHEEQQTAPAEIVAEQPEEADGEHKAA